jgi:hypothetical protein
VQIREKHYLSSWCVQPYALSDPRTLRDAILKALLSDCADTGDGPLDAIQLAVSWHSAALIRQQVCGQRLHTPSRFALWC